MKTYTYQIGTGPSDDIATLVFAEEVFADSLGEAIDKAKAITNLRPPHPAETTVCLLDDGVGEPVWIRPIEDVRGV